jgi:hypothetical protein
MKWKEARKIKKCCKVMKWCCICQYNSFCFDKNGIKIIDKFPNKFKKKDFQ